MIFCNKNFSWYLPFKVVEGSVLAIPPEDYLIPQRPKRAVYAWELSRTTLPATSLILRSPTTADVFGYLHRRVNHIDTHSLWGLSLTGIIWKTLYWMPVL